MSGSVADIFIAHEGVAISADRFGVRGAQPIILLHGGGQTRNAWGATAKVLGDRGYDVISMDLRGHGDSGWSPARAYNLSDFRDDLAAVAQSIGRPAIVVGASLGGLAGLLVGGECARHLIKALVLVDITHQNAPDSDNRILAFMTANREGFASVDAAADAVAAYLPHRPRPRDTNGLLKNLRLRDGRYFWHWDPAFVEVASASRPTEDARLAAAAQNTAVPTLLIRGAQSEIVGEEEAAAFAKLVPDAQVIVVGGAHHMVAGDQNTVFAAAVFEFLDRFAPATL